MKIIVKNKKELLESLNKVNNVVEKKNTLQILSNVFLSAQNDVLTGIQAYIDEQKKKNTQTWV